MNHKMPLLVLTLIALAGCATSTRLVNYTVERFPPKDVSYTEDVYSQAQPLKTDKSYYVIGSVSIEGFASNGVSPTTLTRQAQDQARRKGADAIINAATQVIRYWGGDALLRFKGDLIVYAPSAASAV